MRADEFDTWASDAIEAFAIDLIAATGTSRDLALAQANEQFPLLFPDGVDTADTWAMVIEDATGNRVGTIWIGPHPTNENSAFVWDIKIDEPRQGQGFGRAAMLAAEELAVNGGRSEIGLNVFGFNERARGLYTSLGYRVVSTTMAKDLPKSQ
jgi:ribosomal protein S18 acetylase RimI-like enzyme